MRVEIKKYPSRWNCDIYVRYMEWKHGPVFVAWEESVSWDEKILEKIETWVQLLYNHTVNRYYDNAEQKVSVRIDPWDTWSMDYTLAPIILPMLKQLKETKHGAPFVNNEDVPSKLQMPDGWYDKYSKNGETDPHFFERWDYVLDEMIYAFEQKCSGEEVYVRFDPRTELEEMQAEQDRISNGFRLFGKYYESLWD